MPSQPANFNYWQEINPSKGAAVVFAILFGASAFFHVFQLWKYKAWYFIAFTTGSLSKSPTP